MLKTRRTKSERIKTQFCENHFLLDNRYVDQRNGCRAPPTISGGQMQVCLGISVAEVFNQAAQDCFILGQFTAGDIPANQIA
jgi:hypothetical protein